MEYKLRMNATCARCQFPREPNHQEVEVGLGVQTADTCWMDNRRAWGEAAQPMSSPDFTTEHSSLLGSSESLESLPPLTRVPSEQEPDWLKDAANTLASSDAALDIIAAAKAALQRSEETLGLMRKANDTLAGERQAAALAALAAAEQHAEECQGAQAVVAAARAQAQRAQVTAKAASAWSRLGSEAARSAALAEVERVHAALAVQQQHSTAATRWVRGASAARAMGAGRRDVAASRAQAVLAASADNLERVRRELRASREAGEEGEEADEMGVGGGEPPWLVEAIRVVEAAEAARGAAPAFFTAVATLRHGLARRFLHRVAAYRT